MHFTDENIKTLSKDFVDIWYAYESKEQFITYDENGVKFDYFECCKFRVTSMGMTLEYVFNQYQDLYTKQVLINAFALALSTINKEVHNNPLKYKSDVSAYFASIHTLISVVKKLKETID